MQLDEVFNALLCIDSLAAFRKIDDIRSQFRTTVSNTDVETNAVESSSAGTDALLSLINEDQVTTQQTNETTPTMRRREFSMRKRNSELNESDDEAEPVSFNNLTIHLGISLKKVQRSAAFKSKLL